MHSYRCLISGKVQGVYYRKNIEKNALKHKFKGYIKNLSNGIVEACVECKQEEFEKFLEILKEGSPDSRVENIEVSKNDERFSTFEIRY